MTAEFYKNFYQSNNFRLRILGHKRALGKTQTEFLVIVVKIYTEADFKVL